MAHEVDIAVVGAGAAGLGAARRLAEANASFVVLEARGRVGGRTQTVRPWADLPIDLGAEWLHSADRNPLAQRFAAAGLEIDRTPSHWTRQTGGRHFPADDQAAFRRAYAALEDRLEAAADAGREGRASDHLEPDGRWNPLLDAVSGYYNGAELDQVSVLDYGAYVDTGKNWRLPGGYGAALAGLAAGDIRLGCAVRRIDHRGARIRLVADAGDVSARAVIVTLPTPILARQDVAFDPPLPQKVEAASGLPLGLADKVFIALDEPEALPVEGHLFGDPHSALTGSYHTRPFGRPLIEAYLGGRRAEGLEPAGAAAMQAFAMEQLCGQLGSDFARRARPIVSTAWRADPLALGSYSHALPGHAGDRARLAAPVDDRLFFAGEATSPEFFSTVHGAWISGERAADEALAALR
ncbi:MAG TPA: NAD(P)/FAD-dependent oxidoreductase [Caulobacteraceae bacterium]|nr:NAD(P)/FAD-dependent oxidoreductase [Caulobacteraceae bacterium]